MTPPPAPASPGGPAYPMPPMMQPPAEPEPADASRRGKPKRRRFNFNVLENLEKMVQAKPAEPAPQTGWTPPAAPIPPAVPIPPAASVTPTATGVTAPIPALTPSPETATVTPKPEAAPTLPFLFGAPKPAEPAKEATTPAAEPKAPEEAAAADETVSEESKLPEPETTAGSDAAEPSESAPEPVAEEPTDTGQSSRRSMRSMMFGEEITDAADEAAAEPQPASVDEPDASPSTETTAATTETEAPSTTESESTWPSYPWERRQDTGATAESEEPAADAAPDTTAEDEPSADREAWKSSEEQPAVASTSEYDWSPSGESAPDEASGETPMAETAETTSPSDSGSATSDTPDSGKPSAGTLVIIEDDQTTASYYSTLFRGNGYQVEVATDGVSGVDLCARVQPQVILLDVMMPRQNGILVLQTLRASDETKNTPVVVMSNFSEPTLIKRALQLGALEYVIKTQVEGPALLNALPRWMNREKAFAAA